MIQGFIPKWETAIDEMTGIKLRITVKEMTPDLELLQPDKNQVEFRPIIDDAYAANIFRIFVII
jgi:hypothetical protein